MELVAKDRMREIEHWSRLKKELDDGTFDTQNVNTHQTKAYAGFLSNKKKSLRETTAAEDVFNVLTQLSTLHRLKKEGVLKENEKMQAKIRRKNSNDKFLLKTRLRSEFLKEEKKNSPF